MGIINSVEDVLPNNPLHEAIYRINVGQDMSEEAAYKAFRYTLDIENDTNRAICMGILLNGIVAKKPHMSEILGILNAALDYDNVDLTQLAPLEMPNNAKVIGYAGSGKKGIKTINVSSCATVVAAAAGTFVAKSCSNSTSSVTGSADFMEVIGANLKLPNDEMISILKKTGLSFFKIENLIPKFDKIYGGQFYAPNALSFGLAGILLPFRPSTLFYGLAHPNIQLLINVLKELGYESAFVASTTDDGIHFLDEIGIFGMTSVVGIRHQRVGRTLTFSAASDLNLPAYTRNSVAPENDVINNVRAGLNVLMGKGKAAHEDIVCVNAGTILYLDEKVPDLDEGYHVAKEIIASGKALDKLREFILSTGGDITKMEKLTV